MFVPGESSSSGALRSFQANQIGLNRSLERLSTGQRINRGSDDPAGLITSENLRAVLAFLESESRSLERTNNVAATADSALGEVTDLLTRAEALEVANANEAGISDEERAANEMEINQIHESVNRMLGSATFNGDKLFDGDLELSASGGESLEVDALRLGSLGDTSEERTQTIRDFRTDVLTTRGELGAFSKNTIGSQLRSTSIAIENLTAAESMVRDTDFAKETANLARFQTLTQTSVKALAFLQSSASDVLALLS